MTPESQQMCYAIRPASTADARSAAELHKAGFPGFFLTLLGVDFLDLFYGAVLEDPGGILLVAHENAQMIGFVAGVTNTSDFYRRLAKRQFGRLILCLGGTICRRPGIVWRVAKKSMHALSGGSSQSQASLMSIAVLEKWRRKGIGASLVKSFCQALDARRVDSFCLTTD